MGRKNTGARARQRVTLRMVSPLHERVEAARAITGEALNEFARVALDQRAAALLGSNASTPIDREEKVSTQTRPELVLERDPVG